MIAVDTNILVYAHREDSPFHRKAERCLEALATGPAAWAIPWPCLHEFFSVVTHPRVYSPPSTTAEAFNQIDAWQSSPRLVSLSESPVYLAELKRVVTRGKIVGPRVHDARIAALCLSHGVSELWSADRDFSRMPDLKVRNPLLD